MTKIFIPDNLSSFVPDFVIYLDMRQDISHIAQVLNHLKYKHI